MDSFERSDFVALGVVTFCLVLLGCLIMTTVVSGIFAALHHPGDTTLDILYAAVVYTSPYVIYGALGIALYKLKKSRGISYTFLIGVAGLIVTWIYRNLMQVNEDVSFAYSLYDSMYRCFAQSAAVAGVFVGIMVMQAFLMIAPAYEDDDLEDR